MFFVCGISLKLLLFNLSLQLFHFLISFKLLHFKISNQLFLFLFSLKLFLLSISKQLLLFCIKISDQLFPEKICIKELFFSFIKFLRCFFQKRNVLVRLWQQLFIALYSVYFSLGQFFCLPLWSFNLFFQRSQNLRELKFIEAVQVKFKCLDQACTSPCFLFIDKVLKMFAISVYSWVIFLLLAFMIRYNSS